MHAKVRGKAWYAGSQGGHFEAVGGSPGLSKAAIVCSVHSLGGLVLTTALILKAPNLGRSLSPY